MTLKNDTRMDVILILCWVILMRVILLSVALTNVTAPTL